MSKQRGKELVPWQHNEAVVIRDGYHLCEGCKLAKDVFGNITVTTCPPKQDGTAPDVLVNGDRALRRYDGGYVHNNPACIAEALEYQKEKEQIEEGLFGE